jgi:hypothetical protein
MERKRRGKTGFATVIAKCRIVIGVFHQRRHVFQGKQDVTLAASERRGFPILHFTRVRVCPMRRDSALPEKLTMHRFLKQIRQ